MRVHVCFVLNCSMLISPPLASSFDYNEEAAATSPTAITPIKQTGQKIDKMDVVVVVVVVIFRLLLIVCCCCSR